MFEKELKNLELISRAVGVCPDLIQGGGGNTSVKIDDRLMAVKASGCRLKDMTTSEGFVVVNHKDIRNYFKNIDINSDEDYEKGSVEFIKSTIMELDGVKKLRPSVEAGFHSILKKYVIHTHSVYSNILCCCENGKELVEEIFAASNLICMWIPYIDPGFKLTLKILQETQRCKEQEIIPDVIFLENHGLIVSSDEFNACLELHINVNSLIKKYFNINEEYPQIKILKKDDKIFTSNTEYLINFFKENQLDGQYFQQVVLYPDQLVYLNDSICVDNECNKLNIDISTGELVYRCSYEEALTIEEILLAMIFVVDSIKKNKLKLKTMSQSQIEFIKNWESEKYRKSLGMTK